MVAAMAADDEMALAEQFDCEAAHTVCMRQHQGHPT